MTYEVAEPVEYSALEAMSCGLFPVTAVWTEEYYSRAGLLAFHAECSVDAALYVDYIFRSPKTWQGVSDHNLAIVKSWSNSYRQDFENFVNELGDGR